MHFTPAYVLNLMPYFVQNVVLMKAMAQAITGTHEPKKQKWDEKLFEPTFKFLVKKEAKPAKTNISSASTLMK